MRRNHTIVCLLLLLLALGIGSAAAESQYEALCSQHGLHSQNLIAWLDIPAASFCQPVMRHPNDDAYYAKRDANDRPNPNGALYVQAKYNAADFSDPVTLIYGGSAAEDAPFGNLQQLYSGSNSGKSRTVYLHTKEGSQEYLVFAALPYSSIHILHYYDFRIERRYTAFFNSVFSTRALSMHLDENSRPEAGKDQVLILSTGLRGDPLQRYLVMAKKISQ